jgi:hypothetical protein
MQPLGGLHATDALSMIEFMNHIGGGLSPEACAA